jgi:hypothetical protein
MKIIKNSISISLAMSILFLNTSSIHVIASDVNSRFPNGTKDKNPYNIDIIDMGDDDGWVDTKDDWRHGIGTNEYITEKANKRGSAEGDFSIELCDGSYYWYHQTSNCKDCKFKAGSGGISNVGDIKWSWNGSAMGDTLAQSDGGQYAMAMIVSNLLGQSITVDEIFEAYGAKTSGTTVDVSKTNNAFLHKGKRAMLNSTAGPNAICEKYGLECTIPYYDDKTSVKQMVDDILDNKKGMIWLRYGAPEANGTWPSRATDEHCVCIRSHEGNNYYLLDSTLKLCDGTDTGKANTGISFDTLWKYAAGSKSGFDRVRYFVGFWVDEEAQASKNGDCDWYGPATEIKRAADKMSLGGGFYLYDGLPWSADANTYTVNTDEMLGDMYDYVESVSDNKIAKRGNGEELTASDILSTSTRMVNKSGGKMEGDTWKETDNGLYAEVDGLRAVGITTVPSVVDREFCANYTGTDWLNGDTADNVDYEFGKKKMAVVLQDKTTKKDWFMPVTNCSAKDEVFPGGVAQTNIAFNNKGNQKITDNKLKAYNVLVSDYNDTGRLKKALGGNKSGDISGLMDTMNTVQNNGASLWESSSNICEFWNVPDSVKDVLNTNGDYSVTGFVVWDDK